MKFRIFLVSAFFAFFGSTAFASGKYSAIAVDITGPRTHDVGVAKNMKTESSAESRAKFRCGRDCSIVSVVREGRCGSFARGTGRTPYVYGYGYGATWSEAKGNAVNDCRMQTNYGCKVVSTVCSN